MILKAKQRLIDSVWTATYQPLQDGKVKLLDYNRDDQDGYKYEKILPELNVIEIDGRTIDAIEVDGKRLEVVNKQYIFSYNRD